MNNLLIIKKYRVQPYALCVRRYALGLMQRIRNRFFLSCRVTFVRTLSFIILVGKFDVIIEFVICGDLGEFV
jgi:hypothetical protein